MCCWAYPVGSPSASFGGAVGPQSPLQSSDRNLLGPGLDFDRDFELLPARGYVAHTHKLMMHPRIRPGPTACGTRDMKQRFTIPRGDRPPGRLLDAQAVRVAAVVVNVVNERNTGSLAHRQQVGRGVDPVVILQRKPSPDVVRKSRQVAL